MSASPLPPLAAAPAPHSFVRALTGFMLTTAAVTAILLLVSL